jgi:GSH-dependent disulfide-bond oxidoreductase
MIDLYTWTTPNGRKISIALEEMGLDYETHAVNIGKDEQFRPDFLKISPNNKIPAIVDRDTGLSLMESGAILIYLAEKSGRFLPTDATGRLRVLEWLMWQMGGLGPMLGQAHQFLHFNRGKAPFAEERFAKEARRLYGVLDGQLGRQQYVAGDYSIADMAIWPWVSRYAWQDIDLAEFSNVKRWYVEIAGREVTSVSFQNLDTGTSWGADLNGTLRLGSIFNGLAGLNVFKMVTEGGGESTLASDAVSWSARVNGTFNLTPSTSLQASYFYRAPMDIERGRFSSFVFTNVSLRHRFDNNRATVVLRVSDPFDRMLVRVEAGDDDVFQLTERAFNSRAVHLSFQYSVGQAPRVRPRRPEAEPEARPGFPQ